MDYLDSGLKELGVTGPEKKIKLEKYLAEILLFNPSYGLVSGNDRNGIIIRHILDSIAPWGLIKRELAYLTPDSGGIEIADAGTGAGFPGIPLAIVLEDCRFLLIEKMGRRVSFLQNTKAVLQLPNITVIESEVEKCGRTGKNGMRVDAVLCRGFSEMNDKVIGTFSGLLKPGGVMIFYKGKREKIDREIASCKHIDTETKKISVTRYRPPFLDEERHLVVIKNPVTMHLSTG
jgi:16S rRNA (guanine527-N7)-methyltransferase